MTVLPAAAARCRFASTHLPEDFLDYAVTALAELDGKMGDLVSRELRSESACASLVVTN
jgi:hypothetical protein